MTAIFLLCQDISQQKYGRRADIPTKESLMGKPKYRHILNMWVVLPSKAGKYYAKKKKIFHGIPSEFKGSFMSL
ncbi:MAG: hypothetical protein CM15mP58_19880 [Burkholderiaceae bacterium]|nr:MAG: hypothetical protein CM15mP58_19880 [Burkholderiaceae bacterium]